MKLNKTVWGILAFFPCMVMIFAIATHLTLGLQPVVNLSLIGVFIYVFIALALFLIWVMFTVHAWRNKRIEWVLLFLFLTILGSPIYWWIYLRNPQVQLYESSTSLDKENIKLFLEKLNKTIDSGLGLGGGVNELLDFTFSVALEDQKQTEFFVIHNNKNTLMRYSVFAEDIDTFGIYIFTSKEVSELVNYEMSTLFDELGD